MEFRLIRERRKVSIITDDLENLQKVINIPFGLIAPVTYFGRNRTSVNARLLYAITVDLDYVKQKNIRDLLF